MKAENVSGIAAAWVLQSQVMTKLKEKNVLTINIITIRGSSNLGMMCKRR
jgi:hypothetical protein